MSADSTSFVLPAPCRVQGEDVTLRPWDPTDAPSLQAIAHDALMLTWSPLIRGNEGVDAWIEKRIPWTDHMSWAIVDDADAVLGGISLFQFDTANANAMLGYWASPAHRGKGVAPQAARLAAGFCFQVLPVQRISLFHAVENAASCRVEAKAGFAYEGTTRQSWRYFDGQLHDEHVHSLIRADLP